MIPKHRAQMCALNDQALETIATVMDLGEDEVLIVDALEERGLDQADVVLGLLKANALDTVKELTHFTHLPARQPMPMPALPPRGEPWIAWVARGHGAMGATKPGRWHRGKGRMRVRQGMKVVEVLAAGVSSKELHAAIRAGWVKISYAEKKTSKDHTASHRAH
jgi:hypothetical protein